MFGPTAPRSPLVAALVASLTLAGCGDGPGDAAPPGGAALAPVDVDPTALTYAPELGIDFSEMERHPSGLYFRDDVEGEGEEAESGNPVSVHYTGYHPDGRVFDSSREGDQPFSIILGIGQVIPGWDEGLQGMREGGRRTLVIPPYLAYGPEGAGGGIIPPNAVLVFDVELVTVH